MVNLLSNDVNRFEWASFFANSLWVSPLLTIIVCFLMWNEVGAAGLVGILVVFTIVPLLSKNLANKIKFNFIQIEVEINEKCSLSIRLHGKINIEISFANCPKNGRTRSIHG